MIFKNRQGKRSKRSRQPLAIYMWRTPSKTSLGTDFLQAPQRVAKEVPLWQSSKSTKKLHSCLVPEIFSILPFDLEAVMDVDNLMSGDGHQQKAHYCFVFPVIEKPQ